MKKVTIDEMKRQNEKPKCCGKSRDTRGLPWLPCDNPVKVELDGKHYCHQHDPEYVAAKQKAHKEKVDAELERRARVQNQEFFRSKAGEAIEKVFGASAAEAIEANIVERMALLLDSMWDGQPEYSGSNWRELTITAEDCEKMEALVKEIRELRKKAGSRP